jgi:hypothetical protein
MSFAQSTGAQILALWLGENMLRGSRLQATSWYLSRKLRVHSLMTAQSTKLSGESFAAERLPLGRAVPAG